MSFNEKNKPRYLLLKKILDELLKSPQLLENEVWVRRQYEQQDTIVKEGELATSLFYVEGGELRVSGRVSLGDNKHIQPGMCDLKQGALFGESSLHGSYPRIATVTAISDVQLIEIDAEKLKVYLEQHPEQGFLFYKKLFEILIERLKNSNHTVESLMAWGLKAYEIDKHL